MWEGGWGWTIVPCRRSKFDDEFSMVVGRAQWVRMLVDASVCGALDVPDR